MVQVTLSLSEPETGVWCSVCLLPSGAAFEVSAITENGVTRPRRFSGCGDCGTPTSGE